MSFYDRFPLSLIAGMVTPFPPEPKPWSEQWRDYADRLISKGSGPDYEIAHLNQLSIEWSNELGVCWPLTGTDRWSNMDPA